MVLDAHGRYRGEFQLSGVATTLRLHDDRDEALAPRES
jgi:hypothetical protein